FPLRLVQPDSGMRHDQMPNNSLKCFNKRRDHFFYDCGNDDTNIRNLRGVASISSHDAENSSSNMLCKIEAAYDVRADAPRHAAAAHGKYKYRILSAQSADTQPVCVAVLPSIIVDTGSQL